MNRILLFIIAVLSFTDLKAQNKKTGSAKEVRLNELHDINKSILAVQANATLYVQNMGNSTKENDVNSIINDIEKYIDSMPKSKSYSDVLLDRNFAPLRHFFLTTTNKTTVATSFLYQDMPYDFCRYNDTAIAVYIFAVKDGDMYNLSKMTEKRAATLALKTCLLPSLKAFDELNSDQLKYAALSIYYGCKDTREGAENTPIIPYCLTLVASLADIQQYAKGLITDKGLLSTAMLYQSNSDDASQLIQIKINVE